MQPNTCEGDSPPLKIILKYVFDVVPVLYIKCMYWYYITYVVLSELNFGQIKEQV